MSRDINSTSNFKSAKIWIMLLFYVLSFFKKGDTIQGGTLFKGGHYLRKYGTWWLYFIVPNLVRFGQHVSVYKPHVVFVVIVILMYHIKSNLWFINRDTFYDRWFSKNLSSGTKFGRLFPAWSLIKSISLCLIINKFSKNVPLFWWIKSYSTK